MLWCCFRIPGISIHQNTLWRVCILSLDEFAAHLKLTGESLGAKRDMALVEQSGSSDQPFPLDVTVSLLIQ
jgi:hypothetical protein